MPRVTRINFSGVTEWSTIVTASCMQVTDTAIWMTHAMIQGIFIKYIFR